MKIGVATIVAGRRAHLAAQTRALARLPDVAEHVVVAMDSEPVAVPGARVLRVGPSDAGGGLPLAAARNRAIGALAECELAILLDVDCVPGERLIERYAAAARRLAADPGLLCGPVGYLATPVGPAGLDDSARRSARARVIRSFPSVGVRREPRAELFWSLSFAVTPELHARIGGFDEAYVGYGAEDTDYGRRAAAAGVALWFVADAWAYHQPHPRSAPQRVHEVVLNARRYRARWGAWPMPDVLGAFAADGLIRWDPTGERCELTALPAAGRDVELSCERAACS